MGILFLFNACSKTSQPVSTGNYLDIAKDKYGAEEDYSCAENTSKTLVLCKHQIINSDLTIKSWDYFVFDEENEKIIFENSVDRGNVKWFSGTEIEISKIPGTMTTDQTMEDYAWIIDVYSGKKIKKSDYRKKEDR